MSCFSNLIGLRGACTAVAPDSGFYLDQLNITRQEIEKFIEQPYNNPDDFFLDKLEFASQVVANQVYTSFRDKYLTHSVLKSARLGYTQENMQVKAGSGKLMGMQIELCNESSYIDFYLSEISLFLNVTGTTNVLVYDLLQNKLLDTIAVATTANQISTKVVNKTYRSDRKRLHLFIGYDSTGKNSYLTTIGENTCLNCNRNWFYNNSWITANAVEVASADDKIQSNLDGLDHTAGLSMVYSLNCNHADWICTNNNVLAIPIMYRLASDILNYALMTTERFNSRTSIDAVKLTNMRDLYETQYQVHMESAMSRIMLPLDRNCFICQDRQRVSYAM